MTARWPKRITAVGEVLVSLQAPAGAALATAREWTVRIAGAEANFAVAFARTGGQARICTAVGLDPPGDRVATELAGHGLDLTHLHRDPSRPTALMLNERSAGERTVHYYRSGSAASAVTVEQVLAAADGAVVLSGVTLAVCTDLRNRFAVLLAGLVDAGVPLLLDVNLRPSLGHVAGVTAALRAAVPHSLAVFAGRDEAMAVFGSDGADAHAELVLKDGPAGSWVGGVHVPAVAHHRGGSGGRGRRVRRQLQRAARPRGGSAAGRPGGGPGRRPRGGRPRRPGRPAHLRRDRPLPGRGDLSQGGGPGPTVSPRTASSR